MDGRASRKLSDAFYIEYDLTEEEEFRSILEGHRETNTLNPFCRVLLALRLEPYFKEKAKTSKSGSRSVHSSNLTKAETSDVRKDIARISRVSTGNVTKVSRS
jgi:hypothetical protein